MSDYTPVSSDQAAFTATAGAAITGGQLVTATSTALQVTPSTTNDRPIGIAAHDAPSGGRVTVYVLPGMVHEILIQSGQVLVAGGTVLAGTTGFLKVGAGLATDAAAGTLLGICLKGGTGDGTTVKGRFIGL